MTLPPSQHRQQVQARLAAWEQRTPPDTRCGVLHPADREPERLAQAAHAEDVATERLYLVLEAIVYGDSSPFGQVDGDEAFAAFLKAGAAARLALGLPLDGSRDPVVTPEGEPDYPGPELPPEWQKELDYIDRRQRGLE